MFVEPLYLYTYAEWEIGFRKLKRFKLRRLNSMSKIKSEHARSEERMIERQVYKNLKDNKS